MTHLQQYQLKQHLYATARALTEQGNALLEQIRNLPCCPCCPSPPGSTLCLIDFLRRPGSSTEIRQVATQAGIPFESLRLALAMERTLDPAEYEALRAHLQKGLDAYQAHRREEANLQS